MNSIRKDPPLMEEMKPIIEVLNGLKVARGVSLQREKEKRGKLVDVLIQKVNPDIKLGEEDRIILIQMIVKVSIRTMDEVANSDLETILSWINTQK